MEQLNCYIMDPTPFAAFQLGYEYEQQKQLAGAIEFYLEVADTSDNNNLVYESLVRAAICYRTQGGREKTVRDLLFNAISYNPKAREAHFILSQVYEVSGDWHESYMHACIGLSLFSNVCSKPIAGYVAKSLDFQKAVAAWWIGKTDESRNIMYEVYQESRELRDAAFNNHRSIGYPRDLWAYKKIKHHKLINKFQGSSLIERSYSQAAQDMFVITAMHGKQNGTYLEIGSADPVMFNNTYLLEKDFNWTGYSFDISYPDVAKFNVVRNNHALCKDATTFDYSGLKLPKDFDYLQADCEPPPVTFQILQRVLGFGFRPKVITFEHDRYLFGDSIAKDSRALLKDLGYTLVVKDVCFDERGSPFEDWWVMGKPSLPIRENILGIDYILEK
jgi:tetratricopeptide (TPR) repeat protein